METVHPVIEEKIVESTIIHERPSVVFTTKQTETTYTVSSKKGEPIVLTEQTKITKDIGSSFEETIETKKEVVESKFDLSKIRTDTLGKFDLTNLEDTRDNKKFIPKDLNLEEVPEITKEQVKPVIDDILQKGTIAAAARSPILDKDLKTVTKEIVESEKRSYDTKVPLKEERRHSCISPAISLERITESEVESEEDVAKSISGVVSETQMATETITEMKKSDSAMKQMADNIEIIIKQASEDVDGSSEEQNVENLDPTETQDNTGHVSVDSIIEEAVTTVEGYLESKDKEIDIELKKEIIFEETKKFAKERPALIKSLSRDSGEITILPKKKHARTFSVQSSPEEIEEHIYTDSESGKVLNSIK